MKPILEFIFNFVWAAGVAWIMVWCLIYLNTEHGMAEWLFFPSVVHFFHSYGMSVRYVLFFVFFLINWKFNLHHYITGGVLTIVGTILFVMLMIFGIYVGYEFLIWLGGTL